MRNGIWQPSLTCPLGLRRLFYAIDWLIWVAFVLEYGIRLYLAPNKRYFVSHNVIDLLFVLIGPACGNDREASPERNIKSIWEGLWWAVTMFTTVGFGDRFPVTPIGRAIGAGVMILGIGLLGLPAASLASLLVEKDIEKETDPQMTAIDERLERIERQLERLQPNDVSTVGREVREPDQSG